MGNERKQALKLSGVGGGRGFPGGGGGVSPADISQFLEFLNMLVLIGLHI